MPLLETKGAASAQGFGLTLGTAERVFIEDVFSTFLYTGNGSTQTITNGIDLSTKGGLVWTKGRSSGAAYNHRLFDTARGTTAALETNTTAASQTFSGVTSFNSNGFTLGSNAGSNQNNETYASWTFRKQPKFFDVVTWTGDGTSDRVLNHALGSAPGAIFIKCTSNADDWWVTHRSVGTDTGDNSGLILNTTGASSNYGIRASTNSSTTFTLKGSNNVTYANTSGSTYVAYLFAHDAGGFGLSGTDNVISCGSYTGNGNATGPTVTLNYEPQWLMIKRATGGTGNWNIFDNMRGMTVGGDDWYLEANTADAEASANWITPTASGFQIVSTSTEVNNNTDTYIYIAIRRGPMKTPTTGTSVFQPVVYTGTNVDNRLVDMNLLTDMVFVRQRDDTVLGGMVVGDRLRGDPYLLTGTTAAEVSDADSFMTPTSGVGNSWSAMNGFGVGNDATSKLNASTTSNNQIAEGFRRAPGFFDVVCYTGTGSTTTFNHNLGVVPELMIVKKRSAADAWIVYANNDNTDYLVLNTTAATVDDNTIWNDTSPTASVFTVGTNDDVNGNTATFVAYLFATCPGVSKVGSYTGTGNTLQIDCGFTGGARFVLIKRTDSTGDWYVWDTARGIVAGNDPYLLLNSTAAEVTNTDYIDTYSLGFEISSTAPAAINANGGTFIFLAVA